MSGTLAALVLLLGTPSAPSPSAPSTPPVPAPHCVGLENIPLDYHSLSPDFERTMYAKDIENLPRDPLFVFASLKFGAAQSCRVTYDPSKQTTKVVVAFPKGVSFVKEPVPGAGQETRLEAQGLSRSEAEELVKRDASEGKETHWELDKPPRTRDLGSGRSEERWSSQGEFQCSVGVRFQGEKVTTLFWGCYD